MGGFVSKNDPERIKAGAGEKYEFYPLFGSVVEDLPPNTPDDDDASHIRAACQS